MRMPIFISHYKFKIFRSVIISYAINVMNNFCRLQIPTKYPFHYKAVFKNSISVIFIRMVGAISTNISTLTSNSTPFPVPMIFARNARMLFERAMFPNIYLVTFLKSLQSFRHNSIIPRLIILRQGEESNG